MQHQKLLKSINAHCEASSKELLYYGWVGSFNFKIKISRPHFTIIFKPKMVISRVKSLVRLF